LTEPAVGNTIATVKPRLSPMAEIVLELAAPCKQEVAGLPRAAARARVSYIAPGAARGVDGPWMDFVAPLGPVEAGELAWYLESYPEWPFGPFKDRARKLEESLLRWGRQLFDALPGQADQAQAARAFRDGQGPAGQPIERRITILVDDRGGDGEAAAMLLALPWELLADDRGYLFEGKLTAPTPPTKPAHWQRCGGLRRPWAPAPPWRLPRRITLPWGTLAPSRSSSPSAPSTPRRLPR
jgi:hypothetical protein